MDRLDDDNLLLSILSRLSPRQLARCAKRVCRLWRDAGRALNYRNLALIDSGGPRGRLLSAEAAARAVHPLVLRDACAGSLDTYVGWRLWWYGLEDVGWRGEEAAEEEGRAGGGGIGSGNGNGNGSSSSNAGGRLLSVRSGTCVAVTTTPPQLQTTFLPYNDSTYISSQSPKCCKSSPTGRHVAFVALSWLPGPGSAAPAWRQCLFVSDAASGAPLCRLDVGEAINPVALEWSGDGCFLSCLHFVKEGDETTWSLVAVDVAAALGRGAAGATAPARASPRAALAYLGGKRPSFDWTGAASARLFFQTHGNYSFSYWDPCSPDAGWVECAHVDSSSAADTGELPRSGGVPAFAVGEIGSSGRGVPIRADETLNDLTGFAVIYDPQARAERLELLFLTAVAIAGRHASSRKRRQCPGDADEGEEQGLGAAPGAEQEGGIQVAGGISEARDILLLDALHPRAALDALLSEGGSSSSSSISISSGADPGFFDRASWLPLRAAFPPTPMTPPFCAALGQVRDCDGTAVSPAGDLVAINSRDRIFLASTAGAACDGGGAPWLLQVFPPCEGGLLRRSAESGGATPVADLVARLAQRKGEAAGGAGGVGGGGGGSGGSGGLHLPHGVEAEAQEEEDQQRLEPGLGCAVYLTQAWSPCGRRFAAIAQDTDGSGETREEGVIWRLRLMVLELPPEYARGGSCCREPPSRLRLLVDDWRRTPLDPSLQQMTNWNVVWCDDGAAIAFAVGEGAPVLPDAGGVMAPAPDLAMVAHFAPSDTPEGGLAFWSGQDGGAEEQGDWAVVDAAAAEPSPLPLLPPFWLGEPPRVTEEGQPRRAVPVLIERAPEPQVVLRGISGTLAWMPEPPS